MKLWGYAIRVNSCAPTLYFNIIKFKLHNWVGGLRGDAAVVVVVPGHLDVARVAPSQSPAVLHDVVILSKEKWDFDYVTI